MKFISKQPIFSLLAHVLPNDSTKLTEAADLMKACSTRISGGRVLDLGCGVGDSIDMFRALDKVSHSCLQTSFSICDNTVLL